MNIYKQYSTITSGTITSQNTGQDIVVIHNAASLAITLTWAFPVNPVPSQRITVASTLGVTTLTLSSALTIIGGITTIIAGGFATYIYDENSTKWYKIG